MENKTVLYLVAPFCDLRSLSSLANSNKVIKNCEADMLREYVYSRYDERSVVKASIRNRVISAKLVHDLERLQLRLNKVRQLLDIFELFASSDEVTVFDVRKYVADNDLEVAIEWMQSKDLERFLKDTTWTPLRVLYHVYFENLTTHFEGPIRMHLSSMYLGQLLNVPYDTVHWLHVKFLLTRTVTPDELSMIALNHAKIMNDI